MLLIFLLLWFVEIDVKETKDAVSERFTEIGSYFKEKLERGEKYTVESLLSRIASVAEDIVKRYVKRATGEDASCKKYFWTYPRRGRRGYLLLALCQA
jgi:hypothetical protein